MKIHQFISILIIISSCAAIVSSDSDMQIPDTIRTQITDALKKVDEINIDDSAQARERIRSVREEMAITLANITDSVQPGEISNETARLLNNYITLWDTLLVSYDYMIQGGDQKIRGYDAILSNETDRFKTGLEAFAAAEELYGSAYDQLRNTESLFATLDSDTLTNLLSDTAVPTMTSVKKMLYRLLDNIVISQAYQGLCKAEISKEATGDVNSSEVQEPLTNATYLMKKLISSPYVGQEASLFANITLT
jgi:hypothetical protein